MDRLIPDSVNLWIVATVLVTVLSMPAIATTSGQPISALQHDSTGQLDSTCEYAQLYEETIGSVVLVSRNTSEGSGFVYETVGANDTTHVLTNQHVVGNESTVTVRFREGEYGTGTVVGRDAYADLAVVRVDETPDYAGPLPVADSVPRPGREVAALGAPFGLRSSVTGGIVSGVNRSMPTDRGFAVPDVIQTDAPINPGNSGGPLLTCDGRVVGVNTAGVPAVFGENVGFAVSAPLIQRVVPTLVEDGEVEWPYLGVRTTDVTPATAEANDLSMAEGAIVVETVEDGPSEGALRQSEAVRSIDGRLVYVGGDVIVAIDGQPVDTGEDLSSYLATEVAPGDTIDLTVVQDGDRRGVNVTLGERPGVTRINPIPTAHDRRSAHAPRALRSQPRARSS